MGWEGGVTGLPCSPHSQSSLPLPSSPVLLQPRGKAARAQHPHHLPPCQFQGQVLWSVRVRGKGRVWGLGADKGQGEGGIKGCVGKSEQGWEPGPPFPSPTPHRRRGDRGRRQRPGVSRGPQDPLPEINRFSQQEAQPPSEVLDSPSHPRGLSRPLGSSQARCAQPPARGPLPG